MTISPIRLRHTTVYTLATLCCLITFAGCVFYGSVDIPAADVWQAITGGEVTKPSWAYIVTQTRVPSAFTALLAGAGLAVSGLLLQTTFDNPLAGPSILGISTGSSLGVAIVMLALGGTSGVWGHAAVLAGAIAGALSVMLLLLTLSAILRSATVLLIVGILIGYLASSAISLLNFFSTREGVHAYVLWGMGSFGGVTNDTLPLFAALILAVTISAFAFAKQLNALLLGSRYAESSGVNTKMTRNAILLISGTLTAVVTAWCGPIGFIGLVVPHVARLALHTSNHHSLLPATALCGAATGGLCQWLSVSPGSWGVIPVNAITPLVGVPIIIYIIVRRRSIFYFN